MSDSPNPRTKTILIVDDDEFICLFIRTILEKDGFNIEVAYNGEEALKVIESKKIDLLLLDWMMPILSGFDVLTSLQNNQNQSKIPVMVVTASVTDSDTVSFIRKQMNVVEFMSKPIEHSYLLGRVHEVLNTFPER